MSTCQRFVIRVACHDGRGGFARWPDHGLLVQQRATTPRSRLTRAGGEALILLPNGDYVMAAAIQRSGVDLSAWGGPASTTIIDFVLEEITPQGGGDQVVGHDGSHPGH